MILFDAATEEAVRRFWNQCEELRDYPRDLSVTAPLALPIAITIVSSLTLASIEKWLSLRGAAFSFKCRSRSVRGCLIANAGRGIIFVDASDPEDERRFTIAHEIGHFLVDYLLIRDAAIQRFGYSILEVIDGRRAPNTHERFSAIISHTPIRIYTNLMERDHLDSNQDNGIWEIEDRADQVALALLAPSEDVLTLAGPLAKLFTERYEHTKHILRSAFGLPEAVAGTYAWNLLCELGLGPCWSESLRFGRR